MEEQFLVTHRYFVQKERARMSKDMSIYTFKDEKEKSVKITIQTKGIKRGVSWLMADNNKSWDLETWQKELIIEANEKFMEYEAPINLILKKPPNIQMLFLLVTLPIENGEEIFNSFQMEGLYTYSFLKNEKVLKELMIKMEKHQCNAEIWEKNGKYIIKQQAYN